LNPEPAPLHRYSAEYWINRLSLEPHVEGGYYREVYRSGTEVKPGLSSTPRAAATHIYFLLTDDAFSAFHRITADELWHFYEGDSVAVYEILADGTLITHLLGTDVSKGQMPFCVIREGSWFGSRLAGKGSYGLVGCTVAPGFLFTDLELADRSTLTSQYPQHTGLIEALTR
jgi:predicted cupin superfamily sugar epimerase